MFTVYAAYRNADMVEGRGPMVLDNLFTTESDANDYISMQQGVMGRTLEKFGMTNWSTMGDWTVKPLVVFETLEDQARNHGKSLREEILDKLTPAERKILGIG